MFAIPTAALAAGGAFSNNSATVPAVTATNSNAHGVGVQGTGKKFGVYSNGPLGVAAGKALSCAGCITSSDISGNVIAAHAYASVISNGAVINGNDHLVVSDGSAAGIYCIREQPLAYSNLSTVIVTPEEWNSNEAAGRTAIVDGDASGKLGCSLSTNFIVITEVSGAVAPSAFNVFIP